MIKVVEEKQEQIVETPVASEAQVEELPATAKKNKGPKKVSYAKYGYLFILPFFVIFLIFQFWPMIYSLIISVTDFAWDGKFGSTSSFLDSNFVWFQNYKELLYDSRFWYSLYNTFLMWTINFLPQLFFAFLFAAIFTAVNLKMKGAGVFKVVYFLPNILTASCISVLFATLFERNVGTLDVVFRELGFITDADYNLFRDATGSRLVISYIQFWRYYGNTMLVLSAAILGINPTLYEAGEVDGASKPRMFFSITLPLLKPIVLYTLITSLVGGLQMFDIPLLFAEGRPMLPGGMLSTETITMFIYDYAFKSSEHQYAYSSAASVYLFIIALILSLITFKFFGNKTESPKHGKKKKAV